MSAEAAHPTIFQPPADLEELLDLSRFLESHTEPAVLLGPDGQQTPLPLELYEVLTRVVNSMQEGKAITVAPVGQKLTTQQAADLLGISRPTLIKFLDQGVLPYERLANSRHRRIRLNDLIAFEKEQRRRRRETLDGLTRDAVEGGIYDHPAEAYHDALAATRKKR